MLELGALITFAVVALVAIAIYVFAWRATAAVSPLLQGLVRYGIPALVFVVLGVAILAPELQQSKKHARPEGLERFEYRPEKPKPKPKPKMKMERARKAAKAARKKREAERTQESAREDRAREEAKMREAERKASGGASAPTGGAPGEDSDTGGEISGAGAGLPRITEVPDATPPPVETAEATAPPPPPEPPRIGTTAAPIPESEPPTAGAAPPPAAAPGSSATRSMAPEEDKSDWDLVPVFFGTDRARADNAARLDYAGDRGRRLELGHALVSVPKSHQVPNIERPWVVRIPYFDVTIYEEAEDPKKHFVMQEIKALTRGDFLDLVRARLANSKTFKDQAFVFVHGFNTSFENGVYRTAQIAYDLKFDGAPFLYSWPSGGGVASYTYDRESSGQSTPYMRDFMKLVINETGAKAVSVIAHSMGNQPILQVLKDLKNATPDDVIISQVILAAPDVDRDNFENIAKEILGLAKGITLYVASNDQALEYSRRFHGGIPRAGDVPPKGPLVISGIDTIDVTEASTDSLGINHSGYAENNALLGDIKRLIATGAAPQDRQPPQFERIESEHGGYWKYPGAN